MLRDIWDIVKLDNVASFAAGAGFFALVGLAVERRRRVALAAAAGALSIAFSLAWLVVTAVRAPAEMVFRPDVDAWRRAFSPLIPPYARVLTDDAALGAETGFFTPGFLLQSSTFDVYAYLHIDPAHAARAHDAWSRAITTLDRADLDALGVDYVLAARSLAARLTPDAKAALDDGARFEPVLAADDAVLFRVLR